MKSLAFHRISKQWACILYLMVLPLATQASYRVEIEATKVLKELLSEHLDILHYQDQPDLNPDQFQFLLMGIKKQVQDIAATEGYFSPIVHVSSTEGLVTVGVEEGKQTQVTEVEIELSGEVEQEHPPRAERIRSRWRLPVGAPFRQADWDEAKNRALQRLQAKRYPAAKLAESEAHIDASQQTAALWAHYDSGPIFNLGELSIEGLKRYPELIIRHLNPLFVGEEYDSERLLEFQRQIQSTPYFSQVNVSIETNAEEAKRVPVNIQVTEFPIQSLKAGGGYASDRGMHLESRYTHLNVFKRAWVANTDFKLEQKQQSGSFELAMPPDEKGYINSGWSSIQRSSLAGIDLNSVQASLRRTRQLEKYKVSISLDYFLDTLKNQNAPLSPADNTSDAKHQATMLGLSWSRRDVDNPIFPRSGNIINTQGGFALKGLMTDESFFRLYGRLRQYWSLTRQDNFIFRAEGGSVFSKGGENQVPASLLFRTGGTDSVRGYGYQSIGNTQNGTVYPTKFMLSGGVEYQHWLSTSWGGAVFTEAGMASNNWATRQFYQGFGAGARWRSPVGAVNMDLAYGVRDQKIRPHVSLGVAF